jgi:hypothetical protein
MSAEGEETMPDVDRRRLLRPEPDFPLSIVLGVLLLLILAAGVLVINVVMQVWR